MLMYTHCGIRHAYTGLYECLQHAIFSVLLPHTKELYSVCVFLLKHNILYYTPNVLCFIFFMNK